MPLDFAPPFCPSRMLVRSDDRPIDAVLLPVDLAFGIGLLLQGFKHLLPHAGFHPSGKAAGHRAPRTIVLWQVSPRGSSPQDPENPMENQTMLVCWTTHAWLLWRQQGSQLLPLLIRQCFSSHPPASRLIRFCKQALALNPLHSVKLASPRRI